LVASTGRTQRGHLGSLVPLRGRLTGGCLAIGGVELAQITRNALLDLARRRSIVPFMKLLSREFTALNLLPSIADACFGL